MNKFLITLATSGLLWLLSGVAFADAKVSGFMQHIA